MDSHWHQTLGHLEFYRQEFEVVRKCCKPGLIMWVRVSTVNCLIMVGALIWKTMADTSSFLRRMLWKNTKRMDIYPLKGKMFLKYLVCENH